MEPIHQIQLFVVVVVVVVVVEIMLIIVEMISLDKTGKFVHIVDTVYIKWQ